MKADFFTRVKKAAKSMLRYAKEEPATGIILGSGLNELLDSASGTSVPFAKIDGFPVSGTEGHKGICKISSRFVIFAGRFHYYEGLDMDDVVLPIFVLKALGVSNLIVTNASGGINPSFEPGDLVLIKDHINLMNQNPLRGRNNEAYGPRFPDMKFAYTQKLKEIARDQSVCELKEGVYAAVPGPCYETQAEARMLQILGADMVGMSTVPEVISAVYCKMNVLGISCITNRIGLAEAPITHEEVMETGKRVSANFTALLKHVLSRLGHYGFRG